MFKLIHPKYLRAIIPAILICATLLVASCNNDSTKETEKVDSTVLRDNTNMTIDTTGDTTRIDTMKGEQTPPPR